MKSVGELVTILKGRKAPEVHADPLPGTERYLQINDLRGTATPRFARDPKGVLANEGDVLLAWDGANAGTVGFGLEGYAGSTIAILRPQSKNVYGPFLGYFLHGEFDYIQKRCTGATIPHVNRRTLEEMELELPPVPEQKRIAAVLAKADRLRRLRRFARELSDTYLQSVLLEMFGDPVANPMGWKSKRLSGLVKIPITYGVLKPGRYIPNGIPMLRIQDIQNGHIRLAGIHRVSPELSQQYRRTILNGGEIVISLVGTLGLVAIVPEALRGANVHRNLAVIAPSSIVDTRFLYQFLSLPQFRDIIQQVTKGGVQSLLNLGDLRESPVPLPPLSLQRKFARIAHQFERLRAQQREAERQAEHLFQTLLHQAFQGEL